MWRRYGDYVFALLVLAVFTSEAVALVWLTSTFIARLFGLIAYGRLFATLLSVVASTAVALLVLSVHILVYYAVSAHREDRRRALVETWTRRLVAHVIDDAP